MLLLDNVTETTYSPLLLATNYKISVTVTGELSSGVVQVLGSDELGMDYEPVKNGRFTEPSTGIIDAPVDGTLFGIRYIKFSDLPSDGISVYVAGAEITPGSPLDVILNVSDFALQAGGTFQMEAVLLPVGVDQAVTWSTGSDAVATISGGGLVTAVAEGETTVTATSDINPLISSTVTLTVTV